jgi:nucleoside-diphosphate-sugar epimerase
MFSALQKLTGYSGTPEYGPERGGDIKHSLADICKAEKHLGYKPKVNFEQGLRLTVDWYRQQRNALPENKDKETASLPS